MKNIAEILKDTFLFQNISKKDIEHCCGFKGCEIITYKKNDIMLSANSKRNIGIILDGKATIISGDEGVIIKKLESGDIYGVAILFDEPKYLTKVIARGKTSVLILNREFIQACIEYNTQISFNYIEYLAKKISFLNKKVATFSSEIVEEKLRSFLLAEYKKCGSTEFALNCKEFSLGTTS